jgi:hypothetical protein
MDDPLVVRGLERIRDLARDGQRLGRGNRAGGDTFGKGWTVDELHHEVVRAHIVERTDVRMIQRGHRASLALEPFAELPGGDFDGDGAVQTGVASAVDFSHAAGAYGVGDFVGAEAGPGGEKHIWRFYPAPEAKSRAIYTPRRRQPVATVLKESPAQAT